MNNTLRKLLPFSTAATAIIALNLAVILFHLLVISGFIPFQNVWGGRLETATEMYAFETASAVVNLILVMIVAAKRKRIARQGAGVFLDIFLWIFVALFLLNTLGNLAAKATLETWIATPLTFILAILCWRVAIEKPLPITV